jgi:hypothetical protein
LKPVEIILSVKKRLFFVSVEIFKTETFESRFGCIEIFIEIFKFSGQLSSGTNDFWAVVNADMSYID